VASTQALNFCRKNFVPRVNYAHGHNMSFSEQAMADFTAAWAQDDP
jgi:hypothetical protein